MRRVVGLLAAAMPLTLLAGGAAAGPMDPDSLPKMGVGLSGVVNYMKALPFSNVLLLEDRGWRFTDTEQIVPVGELDVNGYPVALGGRTVFAQPFQNNRLTPAYPVGRYVVTWEGSGDVVIPGSLATLISGSAAEHRRVYEVTSPSSSGLRIELSGADGPDRVKRVRVWAPNPDDPFNASLEPGPGERERHIHPDYVAHLAETSGLFGVIRFMDWGSTNASPQVVWAHRRPPEHAFANGIRNYLELITPGTVSGLGGIGVPYEFMIELANEAQMDAWVCLPHAADDNYVRQLARLFRYGSDESGTPYTSVQVDPFHPPLDADLRLWVEHSNEIWSSGGAFVQGDWSRQQGALLGINEAAFNGLRAGQIWQIFNEEWAGETDRIVKPAGAFTGNPDYTRQWLDSNLALDQTTPTDTAADVIAVTTYFGQPLVEWVFNERLFLSADLTDPQTDPSVLKAMDHLMNDIVLAGDATGGERDAAAGGFGSDNRDLAQEYGLPLVAYEGNSSMYTESAGWWVTDAQTPELTKIVPLGTPGAEYVYSLANFVNDNYPDDTPEDPFDGDRLTKLIIAINRHPAFGQAYRTHLTVGKSLGLFTHSAFVDVFAWSKYGLWGHKEYQNQPVGYGPGEAVKWQALIDFWSQQGAINEVGVGSTPVGVGPVLPPDQRLADVLAGEPMSLDIPVDPGDGPSTLTYLAGTLPAGLTFEQVSPSLARVRGTVEAGVESRDHRFMLREVDADGDAAYGTYSIRTLQQGEETLLADYELRPVPIGTASVAGAVHAPGVSATHLMPGPGVSQVSTYGFGFLVTGFKTRSYFDAIDKNDYLSVTLDLAPDHTIDLSRVTLSLGAQNDRSFSAVLASTVTGVTPLAGWRVDRERLVTVDLSAVPELKNIRCGVELRVYIFDISGSEYEGFGLSDFDGNGVPDVAIEGSVRLAPGARTDINQDGFVDFGDIQTFVQAFLASDPIADSNGDGFLDFGDIQAFLTAFLNHC